MMKKNLKIAALGIALLQILLLSACSSGEGAAQTDGSASAAPETTEEPVAFFTLDAQYVIVRPDTENATEIQAMQLVKRAVKKLFGADLTCMTDWKRPDQEVQPGPFEILIGETNRAESADLIENFAGVNGAYRVYAPGVIAIAGGTPQATLSAARAFLKDHFGYEENEEGEIVTPGLAFMLRPTEPVLVPLDYPTVTLNGTNLLEYTLVSSLNTKDVNEFRAYLQAVCGKKLPLVTPDAYTGGPALYLGMIPGSATGHGDGPMDPFTYYTQTGDGYVAIDFKGTVIAGRAFSDVRSRYFPNPGTKKIQWNVPEGTRSYFALTGESYDLARVSSTETVLAAGVTYENALYRDRDGKPVRVYALITEPGAATFYAGTPNDEMPKSGLVSTVMSEMTAAQKNGKNVIAGVNAGFFDMGGTGLSRGLCVKDGKVAAPNTTRPFFCVDAGGTAAILASAQYSKKQNDIVTAVAGNAILLKNGMVSDVAPGTDMAVTRHPRTAVGIRPDGGVVILEVDGRQPERSNGATYGDLVGLFREYGCTDALNLDGGGSSTFIIRNQSGSFVLQNTPSDGSMRKVQDSLLVVLP